ncbi:hypothetical protein DXG03_002587 [Asterophora parasitica]|uniref:Nucleolar protein 12 n=1 Tax=Asterophora parasitica TaxID=117018 RepID=A0A9P7G2S4_9AGAR|nr:hypothetical protein DXG03_002587 [Asterophora parasitica]
MSLSSLLISKGPKKAIDSELDALFTAKPTAPSLFKQAATPIAIPGSSKDAAKKRKAAPEPSEEPSKRSKPGPSKRDQKPKGEATPKVSKSPRTGKESKKPNGKGKAKELNPDSEESDLENAYDARAHVEGASDDEADQSLVHESLLEKSGKKANKSGPKVKFVPSEETPEQRDQRTIFVGNLSVDVAQKRASLHLSNIELSFTLPLQPLLKQLQRHILSQVPKAKIESTRFRSVPFQAPTSKLTEDDGALEGGKPNPKPGSGTGANATPKAPRPHDLDRTSTWRTRNEDKDTEEVRNDEKKYLNPNQKKKIAFINQEFHSTANTVNAYIVFAHPVPADNRPVNLPPPPTVLDPYEAARSAVKACDGSLFMERVIRVDLVGKKSASALAKAVKDGEEGASVELELVGADPKSSVFVGNLDFASKEEDLRVFFEGVLSAERGPPPVDSDDEENEGTVKKPKSWVTRVRIVRDKETQLGKGFAYVQFAVRMCSFSIDDLTDGFFRPAQDRESVDEVLAMEPVKLKFAKRKLRVQRCRTLPGSSASTRQATAGKGESKNKNSGHPPAPAPIVVPKGDPSLGEKLAHLPKDARKQAKASDADRVARRLAKKKARMSMGGKVVSKDRDRERVRKTGAAAGAAGGKKNVGAGSNKKGRVRSDKSMAKRNGKKAGGK